ncbi:head decoration protein [Magnetospirillum fulvum]|uniref:Phage protein GP19 n=1 Tax=Magnetospirillum fulvum MGU-K5 TaxID=1316936 RepID=S9SBB6_MAGFU|nr:head decoration protein [Magnetospirillum fulvum]EPY01388.1 phage protein GP19 [Magnetospirillum fulvum MGU-K5]
MANSTMPVFSMQRGRLLSSVLAVEAENGLSRRSGTILAGSGALELGTVLGARLLGAITIAAKAGGNTGNGGLGASALGIEAKVGAYTITCVAAAANGGRFQVVDPDGYRLADATVGVAYAERQIGFTIADGATDYVVGDAFVLTVAAGDNKLVPLAPAAVDGTQRASDILLAPVTVAADADASAQMLTRQALVIESGLIWPAGITDAARAAALSRLARSFVFTTTAA